MAEEDLIFGKNRHFFGGIEPSNMIALKTNYYGNNNEIRITATLPNDTVINDQTLCSVGGVVIVRRTDRYPENEFDGDQIANITSSGVVVDTNGIEYDTTYYYSAFPYSKQGVYNRNEANRSKCTPTDHYLFGFDLADMNSAADSDSTVTYPSDVDNATFEPAYMDFNTGVFNYGSWSPEAGKFSFMPRPVVLKTSSDGTVEVIGYLDVDDYTSGDIGSYITGAMDTSDAVYNVMMEWPKIYTKRTVVNNVYSFRCSNKQIDSSYECWCNKNIYGEDIDHFYTPVYCGVKTTVFGTTTVALRSISGASPENETAVSEYMSCTDALNLGDQNGWNIETMLDRFLIQDLLILMAKNRNTQTKYGMGYTKASSLAIKNGSMNKKGLFWGESAGTSGVKVFGMENWWGAVGRATSGLLSYSNSSGIYDGSFINYIAHLNTMYGPYDIDNTLKNYTVWVDANNGTSLDDYIRYSDVKSFGRLAYATGIDNSSPSDGTSSKSEGDVIYKSYSRGYQFARCGGQYNDGVDAGAFMINMGSLTLFSGAALSFKSAIAAG